MNKISLLHLNIQSVNSPEKLLQLDNLIINQKPDFISLNETFLKPHSKFDIEGYQIIRCDREIRKGGGTTLCFKNNLIGNEIILNDILLKEYVSGFLLNSDSSKIAIFSIYSPPSIDTLNIRLFNYIINNFKKFIILGDLNALSKSWFCKTENAKGRQLNDLINEHSLVIMNNKTPTFRKSKNVLDLTICSKNIACFAHKFTVLNDMISDHQPTVSIFSNCKPKKSLYQIKKTNFLVLNEHLENYAPSPRPIDSPAKLEQAVDTLTTTMNFCIAQASKIIKINSEPRQLIEIPEPILTLIRKKRKIRRISAKNKSQQVRKLFNMLNRKIKDFNKIP